uniref:Large ribosomal subunit protein eL14 n=1 Tax=Sus scrofa TaxID=9823 RepID=A0A8D0W3L2_PIG
TFRQLLVEVDWVAYISFGPHAGRVVAIVDVIDENKALVDGPCTLVRSQAVPFKCMQLNDFILKFPWRSQCKMGSHRWAKNIEARKKKAKIIDFDRYKVMKARKMKNRLIKLEVKKLQKAPLLKASLKKALAAAKGHATKFPPKKKKEKKITAAGRKTPAQKAAGQKPAHHPKTQKCQKAPAQRAPAPNSKKAKNY